MFCLEGEAVADDEKKVTFYRLEDLEVTAVALVDRPAVGIPYLVLKRHKPDGEPAAAGEEEESMTTKQKKAAGEGGEKPAEQPVLAVELVRTLKGMGAALAAFLPEEAPEGDELYAAARAFQEAAEKAEGQDTSKDEPMDFRGAWEGMVAADQLWKAFMTLETVVTNIARSDKTPEEKQGLFDTVLTDFGTVARELLGLTKAAPADAGSSDDSADSEGEDTKKSADDAARPDAAVVPAEQANAFLTAINDLVAGVQDLGARLAKVETGGEPPEAPAADGAAGPTNANTAGGDKALTLADVMKIVNEAIAKARHPVFKSRIPDQVPPDGEIEEEGDKGQPSYDPNNREERHKRLSDLNAISLAAQGIPVVK